MKTRLPFLRFKAAAAAALASIAAMSDTHAYRLLQNAGGLTEVTCGDANGFAHWTNNPTINWFHNTAGQGANMAAPLQAALGSWTNVPNASHVPTYAGQTAAGWAIDGQNTVVWAAGNGCVGSCLALAHLEFGQGGQVITESDITFNADHTWRTDGADYDTEGVAAHEFGHSLGIAHTDVGSAPLPTMRTPYFGTGARSLETDDHSALQCAANRYPFPGDPITNTPTMTQGQLWSSVGLYQTLDKGFQNSGFMGSMNPATTADGRTYLALYDKYFNGTSYWWSCFALGGFTSDPGQAWLGSVTAFGVTKTGSSGIWYYGYSGGQATWCWSGGGPFGFTGSGTTVVTIVHPQ